MPHEKHRLALIPLWQRPELYIIIGFQRIFPCFQIDLIRQHIFLRHGDRLYAPVLLWEQIQTVALLSDRPAGGEKEALLHPRPSFRSDTLDVFPLCQIGNRDCPRIVHPSRHIIRALVRRKKMKLRRVRMGAGNSKHVPPDRLYVIARPVSAQIARLHLARHGEWLTRRRFFVLDIQRRLIILL